MNIALGQLNCVAKRPEHNFKEMEKMILEARENNVDIIVFPELSLTGFACMDLFLDSIWMDDLEIYHNKLIELAEDICIVWGSVDEAQRNAYFIAQNKELKKVGIKKRLGVRYFDERRYFMPSDEINQPIELELGGVKKRVLVSFETSMDYFADIDCQIVLASSPWVYKKEKETKIQNLSKKVETLIYVNACGMQNTGKAIWLLDGGSKVYQDEELIFSCNDLFQQELTYTSIGEKKAEASDKLLHALVAGLREFDQQLLPFKPKWIIGFSGGLDSSVNACLLTLAMGKERVIGYNLATKNNTSTTINNARTMAERLGVEFREGSISALVEATDAVMKEYQYVEQYPGLVYENIQARIRGHVLSTFAAIEGGVVINNGNKVEAALGYCTMYGDSIGAVCSLADLTKMDLFELSKQINDHVGEEWVPMNLVPTITETEIIWQTKPSAELAEGQSDPMKWGYHDLLLEKILSEPIESILEKYLTEELWESELGKWLDFYGLDNAEAFIQDLEWFVGTMETNMFKRIQLPPSFILTNKAIGVDMQENQGKKEYSFTYQRLRKEILLKK